MWWKTKRKRAIRIGVASDVGQVRTQNQDAWGIFPATEAPDPQTKLFLVADGMGGHEHGQEASRMAVDAIQEAFFAHPDDGIKPRLRYAFDVANQRIWARAHNGAFPEKMGTTCTALVLLPEELYVAHVGDSRCYCITKEAMEQVTRDHTLVEEMRREGVLTDDEAKHHPRRHALMRALGIREETEIDVLGPLTPETGQRYLLCSDGLAPVSEEEMHRMVMETNVPQEACDALVRLANDRGAPDNVTVLIVSF